MLVNVGHRFPCRLPVNENIWFTVVNSFWKKLPVAKLKANHSVRIKLRLSHEPRD
jgi:hypothetical protein